MGMDIQRNVTLLALHDGSLVVHSTAPFSVADIEEIQDLGEPKWLVDALLRHSTFAKNGAGAFPGARYLAPPGFSKESGVETENLLEPPPEWAGQIEVISIDGAPDFGEIVLYHVASKTLVVADLIIHFPPDAGVMKGFFLRLGSVGGRHDPGMTKPFRHAIKDRHAYLGSIRKVLACDFDRIIVGHGSPIESRAKEQLVKVLAESGFAAE